MFKSIKEGDPIVLISEIRDYESGTMLGIGTRYIAGSDVTIDPNMSSGYSIKIDTYGRSSFVDARAFLHYDDYKKLYNAIVEHASRRAML